MKSILSACIVVASLASPVLAGEDHASAAPGIERVAAAAPVKASVMAPPSADPGVVSKLDAFCRKWMGFLAVRETDNRAKIKWTPGGDGVQGQYVGYSTDYDCLLKDNADPKAVPVATIKYREYVYRRRGPSETEAMVTAPDVLEVVEVTEIFRYNKGEWVY